MSKKRELVEVQHNGGPFSPWTVRHMGEVVDGGATKRIAVQRARSVCRRERILEKVKLLLRVRNKDGRIAYEAAYPPVRNARRDKG